MTALRAGTHLCMGTMREEGNLAKPPVLPNPSNWEAKTVHPAAHPFTHSTVDCLLKCLLVHREEMWEPSGHRLDNPGWQHVPFSCTKIVLSWYIFLTVKDSKKAVNWHYSECLISLQFIRKSRGPLVLVMPTNTHQSLKWSSIVFNLLRLQGR